MPPSRSSAPQQAGEQTEHAGCAEQQRCKDRRPVHDVVEQMLAAAGPAKDAARMVKEADSSVRTGDR